MHDAGMLPLTPYQHYLATRSAIPKAVGMLAIIFASIGAMSSAVFTWGPLTDMSKWAVDNGWHTIRVWLYVWAFASCGLFALHVVAGVFAIMYRPAAPRLVSIYAIAAILLAVTDLVFALAIAPSTGSHLRESVTISHALFSAIALPWPIIALLLMNTAAAKRACVIPPR